MTPPLTIPGGGIVQVKIIPSGLTLDTNLAFVQSLSDDEWRPALKVHDDSWDAFQIFFVIAAIGSLTLTGLSFLLLLHGRKHPSVIFLIIFAWFVSLFLFLVPPADGYDESAHLHLAAVTADRLAHYPHESAEDTLLISGAEINQGLTDVSPNHDYYVWYFSDITKRSEAASDFYEIPIETVMKWEHPGYLYFFYALGILLARALHLTGAGIFFAARLLGLLPLFTLLGYTLWRLPVGKEIVFAILSLPAALQAVATVNPDGEILVLSLTMIAAVLHQMTVPRDAKRTWRDYLDYILIALSCFTLSQCKYGATVALCFLPLLLLFRKKQIKRSVSIGALIVSCGSILFGFLPLLYRITHEKASASWSEYYTFADLLADPLNALSVVARSLDQWTYLWARELIGSMLGNVNILISDFYCLLYTVLLTVAVLFAGESLKAVKRIEKLCCFLFAVLGFLCCLGGMMIGSTPRGFGVINGVQGRYFLPFLFPALLAIAPKNIRLSEESRMKECLVLAIPILLSYVTASIFLQS